MNENETPGAADRQFAQAVVEKRRGPSIIWLIPIVAALIGAWLLYKTLSEQGPTIEITFVTAAGLEAGKTKVKFKDVEVGMVEAVELSDDISHVIVTAEMHKGAENYLTEDTRFWVVRPRLGLGGVSGLSTLVSGAYVEVDPGDGKGAFRKEYVGLEQPPLVKSDAKGRRFVLEAAELGSLGPGAPIYFRGLVAGEVLRHELTDDDDRLDIHIFVNAPYDEFVHAGSRFWNVSGVDIDAGAEGFRVEMASLETLLRGGVTFDSPDPRGEPSAADTRFKLFPNLRTAVEKGYTEAVEFVAYFEGSLRGLKPGAPVEFRGIEIGVVRSISFEMDSNFRVHLPVRFVIKPEQVRAMATAAPDTKSAEVAETLIKRGLRAQLRTGSLLTGQLYVDLTMRPDSKLNLVSKDPNVREFPTVPSTLDEFQNTATDLMAKIHRLPLDEIANNLNSTLAGTSSFANSPELQDTLLKINQAAGSLDTILQSVDEEAAPTMKSIRRAAVQAQRTLVEAQEALTILDEGSPVRADLARTLEEAAGAARSIRLLADYLERKPDALIYGKGGAKR